MTIARWANVSMGPVGTLILAILEYYPNKSDIYITSGTDGNHGATSHHYGLTYAGSPTGAVDIGAGGVTPAGSQRMRDLANWIYQNFWSQTVELIHTTPYDDQGFYVWHGNRYPNGGSIYAAPTKASHLNHVHWALSMAQAEAILKDLKARFGTPTIPTPVPPPPVQANTMTLVDIASYQANLNLDLVYQAGFDAVNIKTSQGNWYLHQGARSWADKARARGMGICTFHWLDASTTGQEQAKIAFRVIREMGGPDGIAHQCDCEDDGKRGAVTFEHWRSYVSEMQNLLGRHIVNYTGDWWWEPRRWVGNNLTPYLWAAPNQGYLGNYPGDTSPHWNAGYGGWPTYSILQYAVKPGYSGSGNLSMSAIRDPNVWAALTGKSAPRPLPTSGEDMKFFQTEDLAAGRMCGVTYQFAPNEATLNKWIAANPDAGNPVRVKRADLEAGYYGVNVDSLKGVKGDPGPVGPAGPAGTPGPLVPHKHETGPAILIPVPQPTTPPANPTV